MTYRELLQKLESLDDEQLDCDLTVEMRQEDEFYPAEFRITGIETDVLDENHPVIYVP